MRPRDPLTPEQERDLEAIDRALAGEPVQYELRELEELVLDIRATAPQMSPAFAARLEHEVSEGFPTPREQPARARAARRRWLLLPALGSLAAVVVALVVVLGNGTGTTSLSDGAKDNATGTTSLGDGAAPAGGAVARDQGASSATEQSSPGAGRAPAAAAAPAPAPPAAASTAATAKATPPLGDVSRGARKVERNATIAIQTPADEFDRTTDAVNTVVARFQGIVASSQIGSSDAGGGEATFDLRIPTDRLDRALAALPKLGHVTERSQGLLDITGSFTSAQSRLSDARAERRGLLRALQRATTQVQIDSLKAQLRSVAGRISGLERQLASLRRRADLATVSLTIRGTGERSDGGGAGPWTPADAADDAVRVLEVVAGVALVSLAVLLPLGLLAAVVALGVRLGRRRRREAALDPA
jgi:hypothetical protein